jgi:outer membrane protein insertion porin family
VKTTALVVLALLTLGGSAAADVRDYLGRPLADVRLELAGVLFTDSTVLGLVETRVGEPLSMAQVRQTIDHLIGLGRFEDVRVFAESVPGRPEAVALRFVVTPLQRIGRLDFANDAALDVSALRNEIAEQVGVTPSVSRTPAIIDVVQAHLADRGYRVASVTPRVSSPSGQTELVTVTLTIEPGPRTVLGHVTVTSRGESARRDQLGLQRGSPFDRRAIDAKVQEFEDDLRDQGHYEASVESTVAFSADGRDANLTVSVDPGPRVRVIYTGDPLPENRRDELVPVRRERSVDLDLLEDASRNIEGYLRQLGYRAAQVRYVREETAGELLLTFTVSRGPLHRLDTMIANGNQAIPAADLAALLKLQPGEPYVDSRVATVSAAISELYRVRGFARASVKAEISVLPERLDAGAPYLPVAVRLQIAEGESTTVGTVTIEGASAIPEPQIRAVLALTTGRPFYRPQLELDHDVIEQLYRAQGFQAVRADPQTSLEDEGRTIAVRWVITEGPRAVVDHVIVIGNVRTGSDLIKREIALQPGQPLSDDAIVEGQRRLAALGLFRRVRISERPHASQPGRDLVIEVEEADPTTISVGGGIEAGRRLRRGSGGGAEERIELAPRGFFEIARRNLWGKNRMVSLLTRVSIRPRDPAVDSTDPTDEGGYGFNEFRVVGTFREPRPFDRPGDAQLTGFLEQAIRASYNFSRRGVRAEYARRLEQSLTISGRYAFDYTRLFDEQVKPEDRLLVDRLFPQVRLSTFTGSVLRDSRNDAVDPRRGAVIGVDGAVAPRFAGSEVGFARTFLQGFIYRPLPQRDDWVMVAGARFGFAVGFERRVERRTPDGQPELGPDGEPIVDIVKALPASERFFAGGDTTVRGFVLDRLGTPETLDDQGYPSGGNGLLVLNLEVRAPYWKGLGLVGFFDAGNVFRNATDLSLADVRPAAGLGARYRSPVGPLRVDFGFNLDRQMLSSGTRERGMVFHISLGQAF